MLTSCGICRESHDRLVQCSACALRVHQVRRQALAAVLQFSLARYLSRRQTMLSATGGPTTTFICVVYILRVRVCECVIVL
jgi:hypothetical protein